MCCHQVRGWPTTWGGSGPNVLCPETVASACFCGSADAGSALWLHRVARAFTVYQAETMASLPSVTTVRITEHNGSRAAVMPAQSKPTGSSSSRLSK